VVAREPDLTIGSWCGKKFRPERVAARPGFAQTAVVWRQDMYEIKSSLILQPGPAAFSMSASAPASSPLAARTISSCRRVCRIAIRPGSIDARFD
jgi:hypothetical protein